MKPFNFRPASGPWSTGASWLFVCLVPQLRQDTDLAKLLKDCREAMTGFPIAAVSDDGFRVTLAQIGDAPASDIDESGRAALLEALQVRLREVPAFTITAGSPLAYATGALCDLEDEPLQELISVIRSVIRQERGPAADTFHPGITHMTLGYAYDEASTDELARKLRRVRPSQAQMSVDAVHLLEVSTDPEAKGFRLSRVGRVGLGRG